MPNTLKLGCSTLLYGGHLLEQALDGMRAAGYQALELCCIPGMAPHFWPGLHKDALAVLKGRIAERGLYLESIGASGCCGTLDQVKQVLAAAAVLGAPFVTTGSGGKSNDEEGFKTVVKSFKEYAKAASDSGVRLSVKPHVNSAVYHGPSALRFLHELDTRWIGLNYDPTHIYRTPSLEDPVATLKTLAPHLFTARYRDCAGRELAIGPVEKQVCGKGALDLPAYFAALREVPNLQYVTLEIVGATSLDLNRVQEVVQACAQYPREKGLLG